MDPRIRSLARNLVRHSTALKAGEKVLVDIWGHQSEIAQALVEEAYAVGARPFVSLKDYRVLRSIMLGASEAHWQQIAKFEAQRMTEMDAYVAIRAAENANEWADVPGELQSRYQRFWWHAVHSEIRVRKTKWVVLRWPTPSMAQAANTSSDAFTDFYYDVCLLDYGKMDAAMLPLQQMMQSTDQVRIVGPGTDLRFSIKGIPAIRCSGRHNIPDGECFTAPVKDSVNGQISFNTASVYMGITFDQIRLEFKDGKVVKAQANHTDRINEVLNTDDGARFVGEFSLGFNPYILHPMKDTLFDEKIAGSFHFTPGQAYDEADNGNRSAVHWDLVLIQRPDYGGGEIWFDGRLIRKDGRFVVPELEGLNPEALK